MEENIIAARRLEGTVDGLYFTGDTENFQTFPAEYLDLDFEGIIGDQHRGYTRKAGAREPWYERGLLMRNERQISLASHQELGATARDLAIEALDARWIGANITFSGIEKLSMLPPRSLLRFEGGCSIKIDGQNKPCRAAAKAVAANFPDRDDIESRFVDIIARRRGLIGWVERPGRIFLNEKLTIMVPEQWIYS